MRRSRQTGGRIIDCCGETGPLCSSVGLECFDRHSHRPRPALSRSWDSHSSSPDCTPLFGSRHLLTGGPSSKVEPALAQLRSGTRRRVCPLPFSCHSSSTPQRGHISAALPPTADSFLLFLHRPPVEAEPCCSSSWERSLLRGRALPGTASCRAHSGASWRWLSLV